MAKRLRVGTEIFLIGSMGYSLLEILWRGFTHWTMALTGGACFTAIYYLNGKYMKKRLWEKCLIGSMVITAAEFFVGCIVNRVLKWNVWDYNKFRFNLLGQVCPLYSALWFLLSAPLVYLTAILRKRFSMKK